MRTPTVVVVVVVALLLLPSSACPAPSGSGEGEGEPAEGEGEPGEGEGEGEGEGDVVERPASVLSTGFFVKDGALYDPEGVAFTMRGVNHTHCWGDSASNALAIPEIKKTGANTVRAVFCSGLGANTPAQRRAVVETYLDNGLVPLVENHDATCGESASEVSDIVDGWLDPDNVAWLNDYERFVILNITNEWGPFDVDVWTGAYVDAVQRLRAGGVHNLLVIDAGGACGQNPRSILARGADIVDADPEHNVMFSVHLYSYWRTPGAGDVGSWNDDGTEDPWLLGDELAALRAAGLPVIVGEIAYDGYSLVAYQTREALLELQAHDVGWLAWSWNQNSDAAADLLADGTDYHFDDPADLSEGGALFVLDPEVGLQATARPPSVPPSR